MRTGAAGVSGLAALVLLLPMEAGVPSPRLGARALAERVPVLTGLVPGLADGPRPIRPVPPG